MKLSEGKAILLFRFHDNPGVARERIKIIKHFNPSLDVYALFGGKKEDYQISRLTLEPLVENLWIFDKDKERDWKWSHTDIMTKDWFRDFGHTLDFDFLYSYEYDLLILAPLDNIYPDIDSHTLALAAVTPFKKVKNIWSWTSRPDRRRGYLKFKKHMSNTYGQKEQKNACLGPAPLFPRTFLEEFSKVKDVEWTNEEVVLSAYAEVLGYKLVDHGMHPGFELTSEERFFSCRPGSKVKKEDILQQMKNPKGRRAFHPVKYMVSLKDFGF